MGDDQAGPQRWCNNPEHEFCCNEQPCTGDWAMILEGSGGSKRHHRHHRGRAPWRWISSCCCSCLRGIRKVIKAVVEHKYFQQGILLAILINTLSMGIEYHNQVRTVNVTSDVVTTEPKKLNPVALVPEQTIPIERQPHVGEVSANLCG
jgi:hypothetical protein